MKINPSIFKAYDIRGIYPSELNEEVIYKIGRAYAVLIQKENEGKITIAVGKDMRLSSPKLKEALVKGLVTQGVNVVEIGLVSTPTFYFAVANYGYDGGMQVSASHNPREWNGLKLVRKKAIPVSEDTGMKKIKAMVEKGEFMEVEEKGEVSKKEGVLQDQIKHDFKYADISKIKLFKVVVDPANAMGALYSEAMFDRLPCELIKMNFELDGTFPNHEADPMKEENTKDLRKRVVKERADIGIAIDGDGDRIFFVDNKGELVPQQIIRGLLAKIFLREYPGATICYDIRPGKITVDMIKEAGGKPVVTRVGHSLIKEKMREVDALFGGESSGHFFLKLEKGVYEVPVIVILKLLQELSESGKSFSELIKPYKKYFHSGEINLVVEDKLGKIKEIEELYKGEAKEVNNLDGIMVDMGDFWFNLRPSNTEAKLRLNLEATSNKLMEEKRDEVLKIIRG
ncbi:MAG: phosphomannomutase/phosphoglucomutase [Parcubacteria group bacterium CG_4_10_14_0_8_um_filter_35_7]|nr:MAG: phosphomannomutase/phosphoglucomutase [Parcubacteria group bacterium CG_4_10_14_0_8_um_filter_35_7]